MRLDRGPEQEQRLRQSGRPPADQGAGRQRLRRCTQHRYQVGQTSPRAVGAHQQHTGQRGHLADEGEIGRHRHAAAVEPGLGGQRRADHGQRVAVGRGFGAQQMTGDAPRPLHELQREPLTERALQVRLQQARVDAQAAARRERHDQCERVGREGRPRGRATYAETRCTGTSKYCTASHAGHLPSPFRLRSTGARGARSQAYVAHGGKQNADAGCAAELAGGSPAGGVGAGTIQDRGAALKPPGPAST